MMLEGPSLLRIAYAANILILTPVCWSLFQSGGVANVFDGKVADSAGLRLLVASLWFAILACSALGLLWPDRMVAIIGLQLIYKSLWLGTFALPLILAGRADAVPFGVAASFVVIIATYPFLLWKSGVFST